MITSSTIARTGVLAAALYAAIGSAHAQHGSHPHPHPHPHGHGHGHGHGHHAPATKSAEKPAPPRPTPAVPRASKPVEPPASTDPHAHHRKLAEPAATGTNANDAHAQHRNQAAAAPDTVQDHSAHAGHAGHPDSGQAHLPATSEDAHAHHRSGTAQPPGDLPADHPPREPVPAITDADRAAAFPGHLHGHEMHDDAIRSFVRIDRLEAFHGDHGRGQAWEADAWIGGDTDRLWLKASGERSAGRTHAADLDVLYGRSISPWWDVVAGARQSFRPGPPQTFAAVGIQGLAPYMFEVSAMAYAGQGGQVIAEFELEYELLLTNRLILQPVVELEFARRNDPARRIGSGLTKAEAGLRLRYEFTRRFAPHIGIVYERAYSDTRDLREAAGEAPDDTKFVVGLRTWF